MKMDQLAICCHTDHQINMVKDWFGLAEADWVKDTVTCDSWVRGQQAWSVQNVAELQFCYAMGMEFEIIRWLSGPNWHEMVPWYKQNNRQIFVSHIGIHLAPGEHFPKETEDCRAVQVTRTLHHTNANFHTPSSPLYGRQYHYKIYALSPTVFIKYIRRVHEDTAESPWPQTNLQEGPRKGGRNPPPTGARPPPPPAFKPKEGPNEK